MVPWPEVAAELPAYGERVRARIAQHGESHPFIRTEYMLEVLDGEGGLFPPQRMAQLQGDHPRIHRARAGEAVRRAPRRRRRRGRGVGTGGLRQRQPAGLHGAHDRRGRRRGGRELPLYRVVDRMAWTGTKHVALHDQLVDLARNVWKLSALVVDATGVGAGLASFLADQLGTGTAAGDRRAVRLHRQEQESIWAGPSSG